jgi:glycosyltransferase involved in cell wall biosynthesis
VRNIVQRTKKLHPNCTVIVIDDGSEDNTRIEAEKGGALVISLPYNSGGSTAVLFGYKAALELPNEYIVKIDADGQHDPKEIINLLEPIINGEADCVVGSRFLNNNDTLDSAFRVFGRWFSSKLLKLTLQLELSDVTFGGRAWSRFALQKLFECYKEIQLPDDSIFWVLESALTKKLNLKVVEVEASILPRIDGNSKSFSMKKQILFPIRLLTMLAKRSVSS